MPLPRIGPRPRQTQRMPFGDFTGMYCGGRLSPSSTDPLATATGATAWYLTPFKNNLIRLPDAGGTRLIDATIDSNTVVVPNGVASTQLYLYAYMNGDRVGLMQSLTGPVYSSSLGGYILNAPGIQPVAMYVGEAYILTLNTYVNSASNRMVTNFWNPLPYVDKTADSASSWSVPSGAWRVGDNSGAAWIHTFLQPSVAPYPIIMEAHIIANVNGAIAFALDNTTTADRTNGEMATSVTNPQQITAKFAKVPSAGKHVGNMLEGTISGTVTFYGNNGSNSPGGGVLLVQSGMMSMGYF